MHPSRTRSSGWDVQNASMAGADVAPDHHADVVSLGTIGTRPGDIDPRLRQMPSTSTPRILVSEAGPGGYGLSRALTTTGQVCWVVAPSLIPTKPGDRVKTTRRDAITLARLLRSGALTPVDVPQGEDAAMRDLCRARAETLRALKAAPCQRTALLRRHARRAPGRAPWRPAHRRWLSEGVGPTPTPPRVCPASVRAGTDHPARLARLAPARTDQGPTWRLAPVGDALPARRGGPCPVAVTPVAARGARTRFDPPRPLRHSRGCTPSAYATGARRPPGGSTTTGHRPARRALVAGAWASRSPANSSRHRP